MVRAGERGASLFLVAIMLLFVLLGAAVVLDLSLTTTRGQNLQNAADAAALAGVQALRSDDLANAGLDEAARAAAVAAAQADARNAVESILVQNGVDLSEVGYLLEFPDQETWTEVTVTLTDADPGRLLSGVSGSDGAVVRSASASFESCANLCSQPIEIPKPVAAVEADGTGDGWAPLVVGTKTYAINHHNAQGWMLCVDADDNAECWDEGPRPAYADGLNSVYSPDVPNAAVHEGIIYWTAAYQGDSHVFCWETVSDTPCSDSYEISRLGGDWGTARFEQSVGGLVLHEGLLYIFSGDHRVHCVNPGLPMSTCAGYDREGTNADLAQLHFPANNFDYVHNSGADRAFPIIDTVGDRLYWKTEIDNLAIEQIVTPFMFVDQSSVNHGGNPERAIDGDTDGRWSRGSVTHTETEFQPWWQIDLGDQELLHSVKLFNRTDGCCTDRLDDFFVFVHDQDMTGRPLDDLVNDTSVTKIWDQSIADAWDGQVWEGEVRTTGRYVRVQLRSGTPSTATGVLSLAEVQVFAYQGVSSLPDSSYDTGTWLQCWDTAGAEPCAGFASARMSPDADRWWGRPFFERDPIASGGGIKSVCMFVHYDVEALCVDPDTGVPTDSIDDLAAAVDAVRGNNDFMGEPFEIPELGRIFIPASFRNGTMVCWDWTTGACGTRQARIDGGPNNGLLAQDYAYAQYGPDCVFALGHRSYFWSFKATDVDLACDTATADTEILPCPCGGTLQYGIAEFEVDLEAYLRFEVRLFNVASGEQVYPTDGTAHSLHESTTVDMTDIEISGPDDKLRVEIFVQTDGRDPGDIGDQELVIEFGNRPHLTN